VAVSLSIAVQHHPARTALLPALRERLGTFELVADPEPDGIPSPLRTYREALRRTPEWATHRLVIQDDAWPCEDFARLAEAALAERLDDIVCFFVPGSAGTRGPVLRASQAGERWARVRTGAWVPTVATSFPATIAADFLEFSSTRPMLRERGDDGPLAKFCRRRRLQPWATVPSLVEHADRVPSLIGRKAAAGGNPGRVAALYGGDPDPRG
jgi:hypothetical protein